MTLAYSIEKLLNDHTVLPYFIHFLDSCGEIELIQFWMHLQSFKSSFDAVNNSKSNGEPIPQLYEKRPFTDCSNDANIIYKLFFESDSPQAIHFPTDILEAVKKNLNSPSKDCFQEAQHYVYNLFESTEFPEFKNSHFYKKHKLDILQGSCHLSDIIHIEALLPALLEMISSPEEHQQLQFIISCDTFEVECLRSSPQQATDDAMVIYDKYISMQASTPLDVSSADRLAVESSICTPSGHPDRNTFLSLRNRFCETLNKVNISRKLERLVQKYLVPLKKSVVFQTYLQDLKFRAKEVSSEVQTPRSQVEEVEQVFSFNPSAEKDSMLSSTSNSKVSLAQVDSLGRYRPMFDDSVWKKHETPKLKTKLTKYLNRKPVKNEEEATEAALAIIQDIQRMVSQRSVDID